MQAPFAVARERIISGWRRRRRFRTRGSMRPGRLATSLAAMLVKAATVTCLASRHRPVASSIQDERTVRQVTVKPICRGCFSCTAAAVAMTLRVRLQATTSPTVPARPSPASYTARSRPPGAPGLDVMGLQTAVPFEPVPFSPRVYSRPGLMALLDHRSAEKPSLREKNDSAG